ncbi:hypothetical protein DSECCO2_254710 [anaerobic digester metagenome]|nr:DsrE family protein [Methanomassiliicoccales archaeon]
MAKLIMDVGHAPFGHENAYAGFFVIMGWVSIGNQGFVLLRGEGVHAARKGQGDTMKEIGLPQTEKLVNDIIGEGARVIAEKEALQARNMGPDLLIKGVEMMSSAEMDSFVLENGERVLTL